MSRIFSRPEDEKPTISKESVLNFFEKRAEKAKDLGPLRAVIYQDKNPDLAERRDIAEKAVLFPKLALTKDDIVLDAGCGTGRWAGLIIPACKSYHGVDVSPGLVEIARQTYGHNPNATFSVSSLDEITLGKIGASSPFTCILGIGVLMYLNDEFAAEALRRLAAASAPRARILLREPVGVEKRLTLQSHFSQDMDQDYNAIYRTEAEFMAMFAATLAAARFRLAESGDAYANQDLNNRVETKQRWYLWQRE